MDKENLLETRKTLNICLGNSQLPVCETIVLQIGHCAQKHPMSFRELEAKAIIKRIFQPVPEGRRIRSTALSGSNRPPSSVSDWTLSPAPTHTPIGAGTYCRLPVPDRPTVPRACSTALPPRRRSNRVCTSGLLEQHHRSNATGAAVGQYGGPSEDLHANLWTDQWRQNHSQRRTSKPATGPVNRRLAEAREGPD